MIIFVDSSLSTCPTLHVKSFLVQPTTVATLAIIGSHSLILTSGSLYSKREHLINYKPILSSGKEKKKEREKNEHNIAAEYSYFPSCYNASFIEGVWFFNKHYKYEHYRKVMISSQPHREIPVRQKAKHRCDLHVCRAWVMARSSYIYICSLYSYSCIGLRT